METLEKPKKSQKEIKNIEDLVEEPGNPDTTQPYLPLSDSQIDMIMKRMEEKGIGSEDAIRELQTEGAFNQEPERPLEKMVEELNRELEEEEDGVAA